MRFVSAIPHTDRTARPPTAKTPATWSATSFWWGRDRVLLVQPVERAEDRTHQEVAAGEDRHGDDPADALPAVQRDDIEGPLVGERDCPDLGEGGGRTDDRRRHRPQFPHLDERPVVPPGEAVGERETPSAVPRSPRQPPRSRGTAAAATRTTTPVSTPRPTSVVGSAYRLRRKTVQPIRLGTAPPDVYGY